VDNVETTNQNQESAEPLGVLKSILILAFFSAILIAVALPLQKWYRVATAPAVVGTVAPEFTLPELGGSNVSLSDFSNKVILLNFWATWCPPCVEEMPSMQRLHEAMTGLDFAVIAVSGDKEGVEKVRDFVNGMNLTFPILLDPDEDVATRYGTGMYPETYIIGRDGMVLDQVNGAADWAAPDAIKYFRGLLSGPQAPAADG